MSKQLLCPECNTANTPGSKFCNHCGARLPKSTSILCEKCQAPNPHSNFYCDNCGARLHKDTDIPTPEAKAKPEAADLPTSAKMFTLPTRQPGDTSELNTASLPDWLKANQPDDPDQAGTDKLPRLSDLTPEQRGKTDDLPGWLIDTDSQELLIQSPEDITTEHFLNLIQDINEEEREKLTGLLNDPAMAGETENLPDWLKGYVQPPASAEKIPPEKPEPAPPEPEETGPDWLSELGPPETDILSQPLSGLSEDTAVSGHADWLDELGSPNTDMLSQPRDAEADAAASTFAVDGVPDWLEELGPPNTNILAQADAPADVEEAIEEPAEPAVDVSAQKSLTDWLSAFDDADKADEAETAVPPPEPAAEEVAKRSLTDWLSEYDAEPESADEETAVSPDFGAEEDLPAWLAAASAPEPGLANAPAEETADTPEIPAWLADSGEDETPAAAAAPDVGDLNWLSDDADLSVTAVPAHSQQINPPPEESTPAEGTTPLPDWLDELDDIPKPDLPDTGELDSAIDDIFGAQASGTDDLDWLDEPIEPKTEAEEKPEGPSLVDGAAAAALAGQAQPEADEKPGGGDDAVDVEDSPDWLSELASFDPNELIEEETAVTQTAAAIDQPDQPDTPEPAFDAAEESPPADFDTVDAILAADVAGVGDWTDIDSILTGSTDSENLPDWLEQLEDAPPDEEITGEPFGEPFDEEAIPEWVADLRPGGTGQLPSVLPTAFAEESEADAILSSDEELADADLPDWLEDAAIIAGTAAAVTPADQELPVWIETESDLGETSTELEAILADLPPAQAPEDMLQKAEIPEWLEELKPRELTGEAEPLAESWLESSGPLAGMPRAVTVEPVIAMPRTATPLAAYTVTAEQMQQARLLHQLVQEGSQPPPAAKEVISARGVTGLQILVAVLLLAAVFIGLYGPGNLKSTVPAVPAPAAAMNTAVAAAAGKTVLVAFEYTPALAGELNHEADMLLVQLAENNSPILTTSQYSAGTAVAQTLTAGGDVQALGLIAGDALGLRQLAGCLGENARVAPCASLQGRPVSPETAAVLADVGLIIVLSGERSSLVNWVEQVGANTDVPVVVGATQALAPVAVPYYASGQLAGYLDGLPAAMAYQQTYLPAAGFLTAEGQYGAQSLVLLVTAVIMLTGGLIFGLSRKKS